MKTTDLRIGNYIGFGDSYVKVYEINENNFYCIDSDDTSLSNKWADLKPIELTEEWLFKMGFEKKHNDLFTKQIGKEEYYVFCYMDKNTGAEIGISINNQRSYFKKGKVHQLQNLYHALTGEELTIK